MAVFQSSLPNVKQVNASYEHETCKKFHVGLETTVFCFYPTRMPQVLGRSPAPSCGLSSPNRPILMKESVLLKKHGTKQMDIHANDANSCFPRPGNKSTIKPTANKPCAASQQHGCETTYHRNIYKLNNPRLSQLYILIY